MFSSDSVVRHCLEEFKSTIVDIAAPEMRLQFDSPIPSPVEPSPKGISELDKNNYFPTASKDKRTAKKAVVRQC